MIRPAILSVLLLFATTPAVAAGAGDNVIAIQPSHVDVPAKLPGDCRLDGRVKEVWAGQAFRVGQTVSISVPCSDGKPRLEFKDPKRSFRRGEPLPPIPVDPVVLRRRPIGVAHLDDTGHLIWTPTARAYGMWGRIAGYKAGGAGILLDQGRPA